MRNILLSSFFGLAILTTLYSNQAYSVAIGKNVELQSYMESITFAQNDTSTDVNKFRLGIGSSEVSGIKEGVGTVEVKLLDLNNKKHAAWICNTNVDYSQKEPRNTRFLNCTGESSQHGYQYIDMEARSYTLNYYTEGKLFQTYEFALEESKFLEGTKKLKVASLWDDYVSIEFIFGTWVDNMLSLKKPIPNTPDDVAENEILTYHLIFNDQVIGESNMTMKGFNGKLDFFRVSFKKPHVDGSDLTSKDLKSGIHHIVVYKESGEPVESYKFTVEGDKILQVGRQLTEDTTGPQLLMSNKGQNWFLKNTRNLDDLVKNVVYPEDPKEIYKREKEAARLKAEEKKRADKERATKEATERKENQRAEREAAKAKKELAQIESKKREAALQQEQQEQQDKSLERQAKIQAQLEQRNEEEQTDSTSGWPFSVSQLLLSLALLASGIFISKTKLITIMPKLGSIIPKIEDKSSYIGYAVIGLGSFGFLLDLIAFVPLVAGGIVQLIAVASGILLLQHEPKLIRFNLFLKAKTVLTPYEEKIGLAAITLGVIHLLLGNLPLI